MCKKGRKESIYRTDGYKYGQEERKKERQNRSQISNRLKKYRKEKKRKEQNKTTPLQRLTGSRLDYRLLIQLRLPHHGVLARHPPPQRPLDLCAQRELAQVIGLFRRGDEALLAEGFVLEALEAVAEFFDFGEAAVGHCAGDGVVADDGEALGVALGGVLLDGVRRDETTRREARRKHGREKGGETY